MGQNIRFLLLIAIFVILALAHISDCKKHENSKKKRFRQLESRHHSHHHHHKHKHASGKHNDDKSELKTMEYYEKREHQKKEDNTDKNLREQLRKFREKINSKLPKCRKGGKCFAGTCCWKGKCKILPHRLNQRCSKACPCSDAKDAMYCHFKKIGHKSSMYGRCYLKGEELGMKEINFIPETIEKLNMVEKKMMKEKAVEVKKMKKRSKKNKKSKKERKNHSKKN